MAAKGDLQLLRGWIEALPDDEASEILFAAAHIQEIVARNEQAGVMALALVSKMMEVGNDA